MSKCHLDFETYSDLGLTEVGAFKYAAHSSTEVLMTSFALGDEKPAIVSLHEPDALERLEPFFQAVRDGYTVCAHNSQFEQLMVEYVLPRQGFWPAGLEVKRWDCTAVRSRLLAFPGSLEGAAAALKLPNKDPRGKVLINLFSMPQVIKAGKEKGKRFRLTHKERPNEYKEFMGYCVQDVIVEQAIDHLLPEMPPIEYEAYRLDYKINKRGVPVDLDFVHKARTFVEEFTKVQTARAIEISGYKPTQRERCMEWFAANGLTLPNLQAGTIAAVAEGPDVAKLKPEVRELLSLRVELSRAGVKKLKVFEDMTSDDDRLRGAFLFSAASTKRWGSRGVQLHNLTKPDDTIDPGMVVDLVTTDRANELHMLFGSPLQAVSQSIRSVIHSKPGLLVADYASIEARVLAWLAGEQWILDAYINGDDLYKRMASKIFNVVYERVNKDQRFVGKQTILGAGYVMGSTRFRESCAKFGVIISEQLAREAIQGYRKSVPNITKMWYALERCAIRATRHWTEVKVNDKLSYHPMTLSNGVKLLELRAPSGSIYYPKPHIKEVEFYGEWKPGFHCFVSLGSSFISNQLSPGLITENITQAVARDVLRDGLLGADKDEYDLIMHVHDEGVAEEDGVHTLSDFEHVLCNSSPWATGLPLKAEGYSANRYRK